VSTKLAGIGSPPNVLLIYGRGTDWLRVKDWLRDRARVGEIVVMQQEFGAGRTLPERFEQLAAQVDVAIAVATPDDVGGLSGSDASAYRKRARQNVWLEVGWFWGRLGRDRIFVLSRGEIEAPSDLSGIEFYQYDEDPTERAEKLRDFLGLK
jgi:predicted nucleotide-binding protein